MYVRKNKQWGILFFAPIYLGTIPFALVYISLSFLPLFTLAVDDLPPDRPGPRLKTKMPPYLCDLGWVKSIES
jgi:hypothetical protein